MNAAITFSDTLTPSLAAKIRRARDPRPILESLGVGLQQMTLTSFNTPSARAEQWAPKKDGSPATLRKHQTLFKAWTAAPAVTRTSVTLRNDRPYATVHQFGGRKIKMPRRPMLPIFGDSSSARLAPFARERLDKIGQAALARLMK